MSLKNINITRWKNYNDNEKLSINVYQDDNIDDGLAKIAQSINKKSRF